MKKILLLFSIILFSTLTVSLNNVSATTTEIDYTKGWFDSNPGKFTVSDSKAVDNDSTTFAPINRDVPLKVEFVDEIDIDILSVYLDSESYAHQMQFYDKDDNLLQQLSIATSAGERSVKNFVVNLIGVKKIIVTRGSRNYTLVYEIEIFERVARKKVSAVTTKVDHSSSSLMWTNPSDTDFESVVIKVDGDVVATVDKRTSVYTLSNLLIDKDYNVELTAIYADGTTSAPERVNFRTDKAPTVTDLITTNLTSSTAKLTWKNNVLDNTSVRIFKQDGTYFDLSKYTQQYSITGLSSETEYTYEIELVFGDVVSGRSSITFETMKPEKEVTNLRASVTAENVSLQWNSPTYSTFDHAKIYRKEKAEISLFMLFSMDDFVPLFETNGTTFKDLTVAADTAYTYKVTTVDLSDEESDGQTVDIRTAKMAVSGGGITIDEAGNYVIAWDKPKTGDIKVLVGRTEYATVPASDLKITIPAATMKFDMLGNPDVKLVHISTDGKEGIPSSPGGSGGIGGGGIGTIVGGGSVAAILNPTNLLAAGADLLGIVSLFVLLGLSFFVVQHLIKVIKIAFHNSRLKRG